MQGFPEEWHTAFPLPTAHLTCPPFSASLLWKKWALISAWISRASNARDVTSIQKSEMELDSALSGDLESNQHGSEELGEVRWPLPCLAASSASPITFLTNVSLF